MNFVPSETSVVRYGVMVDRFMFRLMGTISEPNIASIYLCFFLFYYIYHIKKGLLYLLGLLLTLTTILLTLSRGAYLSICVTLFLVYCLVEFKNKKNSVVKLVKNVAIVVVFGLITVNILLKFEIDVLTPVFERFENISEDSGSGRLELWNCAIEAFFHSPLIGIGLNGIRSFNVENFGPSMGNFVHNSYLEVLAESGIIGIGLYGLLIGLLLERLFKIQKEDKSAIYLFATFICVLLQMNFISVQHNEFFFFLILLIFRYDYRINERRINMSKDKLSANEYLSITNSSI